MFIYGDRVILTKGTCKGAVGTVCEHVFHTKDGEVAILFDETFTVGCDGLSYTLNNYITTVDEVVLLTDLSKAMYE